MKRRYRESPEYSLIVWRLHLAMKAGRRARLEAADVERTLESFSLKKIQMIYQSDYGDAAGSDLRMKLVFDVLKTSVLSNLDCRLLAYEAGRPAVLGADF